MNITNFRPDPCGDGVMRIVRCGKCVLPNSYPGIEFDGEGVCSYCSGFTQPDWLLKKRELGQLIEKAKSSGAKYQVVVPFSGGKDSSYVLYFLRKICGLRALAINFNNGFRSQAAELNLKTLPERLKADVVSIELPWRLMKKLYAAFMQDAGEFCTVCNAVGYLAIMSYIMQHLDVVGSEPFVVSGWARYLEGMPNVYGFDMKYFHEIISRAGLMTALLDSGCVSRQCLDIFMNVPDPRTLSNDSRVPAVFIALPEYLYWDVRGISRVLREELGWCVPASAQDETHFDCTMYPVAQYLERRKYGFSQSTITFSAMIRHGQMTRENAIDKLMKEPKGTPDEFDSFLEMLELDEQSVNWGGKWYPQRD